MTTVTPESLPRHELVGLSSRVTAADNPDLVGIDGEVVAETTKTLVIESQEVDGESDEFDGERTARSGRVKHVPKAGTTFEFDLTTEVVTVEGRRLVARPARRTETTGDNKWR